jgi:hypothetical protein
VPLLVDLDLPSTPPPPLAVSYWLQVTNYGVLCVLFDSTPSGSRRGGSPHCALVTVRKAEKGISNAKTQRFADESSDFCACYQTPLKWLDVFSLWFSFQRRQSF